MSLSIQCIVIIRQPFNTGEDQASVLIRNLLSRSCYVSLMRSLSLLPEYLFFLRESLFPEPKARVKICRIFKNSSTLVAMNERISETIQVEHYHIIIFLVPDSCIRCGPNVLAPWTNHYLASLSRKCICLLLCISRVFLALLFVERLYHMMHFYELEIQFVLQLCIP